MFILANRRPGYLGAIFLFGYPISQLCGVSFSAPYSALAVAFLTYQHFRADVRILNHVHVSKIDMAVIMLVVSLIISSTFAPNIGVSVAALVNILSQLGAGYLIYRLSFSLGNFQSRSQEFLTCLAVLGAITSVVFIGSGEATLARRFELDDGRNISVGVTQALGTSTIACIFLLLSQVKKSFFITLISVASLAMSLYAINLTGTRGSLLAVLSATLFILAFTMTKRGFMKVIAVLTVGVCAISSYAMTAGEGEINSRLFNFSSYASTGDASSIERFLRFDNALKILSDNIFIGVGPGGFNYLTQQGYPHNLFLDIGTMGGLLSLFLLMTIIIFVVISAANKKICKPKMAFVGVAAILFAAFVQHQVSFSFEHGKPLMLIAAVSAAGIYRVGGQSRERSRFDASLSSAPANHQL